VVGTSSVPGPAGGGAVVALERLSEFVVGVVWRLEVDASSTVGGVGPGPVLGGVSLLGGAGVVVGMVGTGGAVLVGSEGAIVVLTAGIVASVVGEASSGAGRGSVSRVCTAAIGSVGIDPSRAICSLLAFIA